MEKNHTGRNVAVAFIGGAALGAAFAYLTAPRAGTATRALLRTGARQGYGKAAALPSAVAHAATEAGRAARDAFLLAYEGAAHNGDEARVPQ